MLVDEVRMDISPKKGSADNWLRVMQEAQELDLTTSATNVFGFGDTNLHRVLHMDRVRDMQDDSVSVGRRGFTSFVSWHVMLENNSFGSRNRGNNRMVLGASPTEYLRHVAVSRIFFDNIVHKYGGRDAVVSLHQDLRFTYMELAEQVNVLAKAFLAAGFSKGDRVGIWSPNNIEWLTTQYASSKAGIILVTINPAYRVQELAYV